MLVKFKSESRINFVNSGSKKKYLTNLEEQLQKRDFTPCMGRMSQKWLFRHLTSLETEEHEMSEDCTEFLPIPMSYILQQFYTSHSYIL